ncbi:acetyl-CoA synthetase-like protein [Parathielavia hyrcaniae]|uniref:Acetyl-CoA synthetase-like protein n=1 Tax=Parathielavia hyrcaniae TaxID=113614 RepID=A0AAN6PUC6_9PEZI|nr:acetyl-CoA synthetase-like protein [Parathielavia hyrcaniae]
MTTMDESLSHLDGGPQLPHGSSVWSILQNGIDANPDRAALISVQQPPDHLARLVGPGPVQSPAARGPDEVLTWSYAQMRRGAARLAAVLARHHVPPQSTTMLTFIPHSAEWALLLWVSALRCLTVVSHMPQVLRQSEKHAELRSTIFSRMPPAVVVVEDEAAARLVDDIRAGAGAETAAITNQEAPFLGLCLSRLGEPRHGWVSLADCIAQIETLTEAECAVDAVAVEDRPDRVAHLYFTSGTSGAPKGVPKTVKNLCASTATMTGGQRPGSVVGAVLGGNFAAMALTNREFSMDKFTSMRRIFVSGELVTDDFVRDARRVIPSAVVMPRYGMSEVIGLFGWPKGVPDSLPTHNGVVSCGMPMPGARIRVVNEEGRVARRGEAGDMHVGSDGTIQDYVYMDPTDDKHDSDAFYEDEFGRWLKTGDIAVLDEAGHVFVVGRKKELIRSVSGIIHPHMIESCLSAAFNVQIRVIGLPSPMNGDVPYPIVERFPERVGESDMKEYFVNAVGSSYCLGTILTLEQLGMESWPMTATGKVMKRELERAALEYMTRNPPQLAAYATVSN